MALQNDQVQSTSKIYSTWGLHEFRFLRTYPIISQHFKIKTFLELLKETTQYILEDYSVIHDFCVTLTFYAAQATQALQNEKKILFCNITN